MFKYLKELDVDKIESASKIPKLHNEFHKFHIN